ncbi:MAG: hypothetical protein KDD69_12955, partial [Bdellovibrionales bacterium]|nr:hypothetical protein [Bdellovibrionales bacterium]
MTACIRQSAPAFASFGAACLLLAVVAVPLRFWDPHHILLFSAARYPLLLGTGCLAIGLVLARGLRLELVGNASGWLLALVLLFFSDWFSRPYGMLQGSALRGEVLLCSFVAYFLLTRRRHAGLTWWLVVGVLLIAWGFLETTGGRLLFTDDHPSVVYRLEMLKQHFPMIPFYNPEWNAGTDARDFFATGIINLFLLFYPLFRFFSVINIYTYVVAGVLFILLPTSVYFAFREFSIRHHAAVCAALLSIATSSLWYRWSLSYGSMGFITAATLFPLNVALVVKLLTPDVTLSRSKLCFCLVSFSLMLCWSMTGIALLPAVLWSMLRLPALVKKPGIIPLGLGLVVVNLPWILIFLSVSQVNRFVSLEAPSGALRAADEASETPDTDPHALDERVVKVAEHKLTPTSVRRHLTEFADKANPLLLLLAVPALLALAKGTPRRLTGSICLWLLALGTVVAPLKPQLELDRMLLLLLLVLSVPVGALLFEAFDRVAEQRFITRLPIALAGGYLLCGVIAVGSVVHNR